LVCPTMNFLHFRSGLEKGRTTVRVNGAELSVPMIREDRPDGDLALGVRPEHIAFDDASQLRGFVFGAEYLGTTQIVTVNTEHGQVKARLSSDVSVTPGEVVGLKLHTNRLLLFDKSSGRAVRTALFEGAARG